MPGLPLRCRCIVCRPLWRWASAILGGFPPRYASPDWVWCPIHGACSLLLLPCTTGALAPLFVPARNALDAALALSHLGLPRFFHWLFHSLGKPLVAPSEVALPRFSLMPGLLLRCRCVVCRPLWRLASAILGGYPPRYASPDWVWRPIHRTCSLLVLPCTTGALAPLFAPARNALDAALDLSHLGLPPMLPLVVSLPRQALGGALLAAPLCRGQGARFVGWPLAPLGPFGGLFVPWWLGVQVTFGPASLGRCLVSQASTFWSL
ncbi:hypothetical protein V6N11_073143 [Hibiscus sabdariffa]|uniref:Uncharacterized protein n=1 Tax=Hibiscus sabdariffa TaxID=183260 RepID=A0ABR2P9K5_9ROSI